MLTRMKIFKYIIFIIVVLQSESIATTFEKIGYDILEEIWRFHPVDATYLGIHKYDHLLPDYSKNSLTQMLRRCKALQQKLDEIDTLSLSIDERIDYHLLKIHLTKEIFLIEMTKSYEKNPLIYINDCIYGVYAIIIRSAPSMTIKINAIRERLRQIPDYLDEAAHNLKHPPLILCEMGIDQLDENEKLIEDFFSTYKDSLSEEEQADFQLVKDRAIVAMRWFAFWLEQNADPQEPYSLGRDCYEFLLQHIHLVDINADSLLKIGKNTLHETNMLIDSLDALYPEPERRQIALPQNFGRDDVLTYRQEEIAFMRNFVIQSNLVTVPDWVGELRLVETPRFLREIVPSAAMVPPGPFDSSQTSYFYMPPLPEEFDLRQTEYFYNYVHNHMFRSLVVHEGYPGHHLQLSIAKHHPSAIRKSFYDPFFAEGWALYCEELMAHHGLHKDTLGALINALYGVRLRAARVIVDVMLQTDQMNFDDAVDFMAETLGRHPVYCAREVKRYIVSPGQPSSYLVGKLQIIRLLDEYKQIKKDAFNLKEFHDNLINHGSIPITLVRKIIVF